MPTLLQLARPLLHRWFLMSRGLTLGARAAVIDGENRVCLIRHGYAPGWQLPGGGVEIGEDAEAALRREVVEETMVEITGSTRLHGIFHNARVSRRDHVLVYVVREFRVLGPRRPDREIAECGFFPLVRLPESTTAGTRARLEEIASGRLPSPTW